MPTPDLGQEMSNRPLEASNTPSSGSASKIKLNAHGLQGWLGRERVSGDIADIVILRPADNNDRVSVVG